MTLATVLRLVAVMVLWAACFPLIAIGLDLAPHLAFAALRAALAGLCLLLIGICLRRPMPRGLDSWSWLTVVAVGATSLGFLGMFHAAEFISPGLATVIANAQPILAAFLAHALLGERLTATGKLGLLTGLAGITAIAWPAISSGGMPDYSLGIAYVGLAAFGVAAGNIAIKRLAHRVDAIMAMGVQLLLGAVPLALLSAWTEDLSSLAWSTEFAVVLGALSIFGTALAFWLWFASLQRVALSHANAFTFLVPIFGLTIGAVAFGERLGWLQTAGAALVLAGIALVHRKPEAATRDRPERQNG